MTSNKDSLTYNFGIPKYCYLEYLNIVIRPVFNTTNLIQNSWYNKFPFSTKSVAVFNYYTLNADTVLEIQVQ